jgi:hypothetical protein
MIELQNLALEVNSHVDTDLQDMVVTKKTAAEIDSQAGVPTNEFQVYQINKMNDEDLVEQILSVTDTSEKLKQKVQDYHTYQSKMEISSEADGTEDSLSYKVGKGEDVEVLNKIEDSLKEMGFMDVVSDKRSAQEDMQLDKSYNKQEGAVIATRGDIPLGFERNQCFTRQSSRILDKEIRMMQKAMKVKAGNKGINNCSSLFSTQPLCSLDEISKICGFSLGLEEETRLANMSLIQAKEEAMTSLLLTKEKILLKSTENRVHPDIESSGSQDNPILEISGGKSKKQVNNLSTLYQG